MIEPIRSTIIVDVTEFNKRMIEAEKKARDTGKNLDQELKFQLELDIIQFQDRIKKVRSEMKDATGNRKIVLELEENKLKRGLTEAKRELNNFLNTGDTSLSRLQMKFNGIGKSLISGFTGMFGWVATLGTVVSSLNDAANVAISFESAFAGVKKTVNGTAEEYKYLKNQLIDLSKTIPATFEELSKIAELGGQLGIARQDIVRFTEVVAKISVTTNLSTEAASTAFARIANVMNVPISQIEKMASVVVALGNKFATTESEVVTFAQRLSGAGSVSGFTYDEIFGIGTALSSVGSEAEAGGTAVSKAFLKIYTATVEGGKSLKDFAIVAGLSAEEFKKVFKEDAGEAFTLFVEGIGKAGPEGIRIIDELLGTDVRLKDNFLKLSKAGDLLRSSLELANSEMKTGNSLNEEAAKRFETTESKIDIMNNKLAAQKAKRGENLLPMKLFIANIGNGLFGAVDSVGNFFQKAGADSLGFARSIEQITEGATSQVDAMSMLKDEIDRVNQANSEGVYTIEQYTNIMLQLMEYENQYASGVKKELISRVQEMNEEYLSGGVSVEKYIEKITELQETSKRLNAGLNITDFALASLKGVLGSMSTSKSQAELDILKSKADQLTKSVYQAMFALSKLSTSKYFLGPGSTSLSNSNIENAKNAALKLADLAEVTKQINDFQKEFKTDSGLGPDFGSSGGGGKSETAEEKVKRLAADQEKKEKEALEARIKAINEAADAQITVLGRTEAAKKKNAVIIIKIDEDRERKIKEISGKSAENQIQDAKEVVQEQKKFMDEHVKRVKGAYGDINKAIDDSRDSIKKYGDDIENVNDKLKDLGKDTNQSIAERVVAIDEEIKEIESKGILSGEESQKEDDLRRERKLAFEGLSDEEKAELQGLIDRSAELNKLGEIAKIKDQYQEKKSLLEQELQGKTELLLAEQEIYDQLTQAKIRFEQRYTSVLQEEAQKQIQSIQSIINKMRELQTLQVSNGFGSAVQNIDNSQTSNQNNSNNKTVNQTNIINTQVDFNQLNRFNSKI